MQSFYIVYIQKCIGIEPTAYLLRTEALQPETWAQILLCCLLTMQLWVDYVFSVS